MTPEDIQFLRTMPLFAELSDEEAGCLNLGEIVEVPPGAVLTRPDQLGDFFYMTLSGIVQIWRSYDRQDVLMATSKPGHFMGEIAILLDSPALSTARVTQSARLFRLGKDGFWKMMSNCPSVARQILRVVAERFRNLEGFAHQREKLISLGTMAAGLAHELNNPASAAMRAASELRQVADNIQSSFCQLVHGLDGDSWTHLVVASEQAMDQLQNAQPLDSLARSDKEETLGAWLEQHQVAEGWKLSSVLVEAALDPAWMDNFVSPLPPKCQAAAVRWLEARLNLSLLLNRVENSTCRISELVKAVKSYTHLDNSAMQEVDIHEGIESTLIMLGHKLKSVTVRRAYDQTLPRVAVYGGELNQVWTNLIDNAIDAVNGTGKICIGTFQDGDYVVVEIMDNGAGIPKEIQSHMFEPFFTTKSVGTGTGLGLVISHRIVADRHGGEIEFESKPGETRFRVRLPIRRADKP